jgi:hypothetical protein
VYPFGSISPSSAISGTRYGGFSLAAVEPATVSTRYAPLWRTFAIPAAMTVGAGASSRTTA